MYRRFRILCVFLLISAVAFGQNSAPKHEPETGSTLVPNPAFDKIKGLAGDWEGTALGQRVTANYKVMSAGSTVMMVLPGHRPGEEMVTMFHTDNKNLMVTHYCSAKNQPRMRMVPTKDKNVIRFEFMDATNLPTPGTGHMVGLTLKMVDKNHHVQTWTFSQDGKTQSEDFDLHRKI